MLANALTAVQQPTEQQFHARQSLPFARRVAAYVNAGCVGVNDNFFDFTQCNQLFTQAGKRTDTHARHLRIGAVVVSWTWYWHK